MIAEAPLGFSNNLNLLKDGIISIVLAQMINEEINK